MSRCFHLSLLSTAEHFVIFLVFRHGFSMRSDLLLSLLLVMTFFLVESIWVGHGCHRMRLCFSCDRFHQDTLFVLGRPCGDLLEKARAERVCRLFVL
ncbi:uncharacterized protein BO95DRAFT_261948 [Aspergillus brunneoviolaceus CBS 621.78]|uniref:Uncharacterized protein n=1 Tax=Aspergillus brunneoviolaceus CBS 621.78 TaxID=1450534 RepID=A0ACD1FXC3_9EURO|nr:hypothetical protein BO95DRAFT_261948 [Aspergillus brunneoviolaceus CBS 621.78]RAH41660.1 hypothetical protein BO95DRAFT_261948 [Aspergillus brunneoviolaceus CBS 621.78]